MQAHLEGKPALPVQVAAAARNALVAVDLARGGMSGVRDPLTGPFGYFPLMEVREELDAAIALLAQGHRITEVSWKPFPTGRAGHGGIVAVQNLMARGLRAEALDALEYHAPPLIHRLVGRPAKQGMEPGYARLCLQYLAASVLVRGAIGLGDFTRAALDDPAVLAVAARIRVVADDNPDAAAFVPARAIARLTDSTQMAEDVAAQFGAPAWPLSPEQHAAKARDCLRFAGLEIHADALAQAMAGFAAAPDAVAAIRATGVTG